MEPAQTLDRDSSRTKKHDSKPYMYLGDCYPTPFRTTYNFTSSSWKQCYKRATRAIVWGREIGSVAADTCFKQKRW